MTNRKYWGFMPNDFIDGEGICVSLWTSGCPFKCKNCHNSEAWDENSGYDIPEDLKWRLIKAISANEIQRGLSILGGEPLASYNKEFVEDIVSSIRASYPNIHIYLWTGYTLEELYAMDDKHINSILSNVNTLIDGRYIDEERDLTLKLRGSRNQRIWRRTSSNNEFTLDK